MGTAESVKAKWEKAVALYAAKKEAADSRIKSDPDWIFSEEEIAKAKQSEKFVPLRDSIRTFYGIYGAVAQKLIFHSREAVLIAVDRKHDKKYWHFSDNGFFRNCAKITGAYSWHTNGRGAVWCSFVASADEIAAAILTFEPAKGLGPDNFIGFMVAAISDIANKAPME